MAYSREEACELIIRAGHRLMESGLIARTWGNISARISDTQFVITPSGRAYETLQPSDLVVVNIEDCSYEGDIKPSSEKGIHADGYRLRKNVDFIIHTHQYYATIAGVAGCDISDPFVPCAGYGMPSTGKLRKAVAKAVAEHPESNSVLMTRHGALCMGATFDEAFDEAKKLEDICERVCLLQAKHNISVGRESSDNTQNYGVGYYVSDPEIVEISRMGRTLHPAIDDLVQIAGVSIRCVEDDKQSVLSGLKGRNAVLIKGRGAICTGPDREAVAMLLKKGCAAALYAGSLKGMNPLDAWLQRTIYLKKYSKQIKKK